MTARPEALCTIPFASNQWWLDGRRKQLIVRCGRILSRGQPVAVLGHTDISGVPRRNRRISRRRAYTVAHVLRREGRIVGAVRGLGARTPRCEGGPRRARCNRRVEVWSMAALRAWKKAGRPW